ncbi:MAG: GntR family transcriptional regulator [Aliishimia sp.]
MTQDKDIYETLRYRLITAAFAHGAKLRAEGLRDDLGCSASTVREALFRLSTEGLVTFQEQRGFRVPERSPHLIHELTHIRVLLEAEGTCMSIRNGGVAWEARLSAAHHQLRHIETRIHAASDTSPLVEIWFNAEKEFHETLISACGSDTLKSTHALVYVRFRQQLMVEDLNFDFISMNIQHHAEILEAALAGDETLTRQKIHDHLARHLQA